MTISITRKWASAGALMVAASLVALDAAAQGPGSHGHQGPGRPEGAGPEKTAAPGGITPRRVTDEELHRSGGVPRGWRFTLPSGDPVKGRALFADLECYKCHRIQGEQFPDVEPDPKNVGPELTGMGSHHPAEYFAESIVVPNAVILTGPGHTGPDGLSVMPSYADSLSVQQLVDLVAFLKSLTHGGAAHHAPMRKIAGEYMVRVEVGGPEAGVARGHGHGAHGAGGHRPGHQAAGASTHLLVFVTDRVSGEPVPYLPVTATLHVEGGPPRTVRLAPMTGEGGFHYGASVDLPPATRKITVAIGRATMAVMPSAKGRYSTPVSVDFAWGGGHRH